MIKQAGFPAHISFSGIFLVTTLPAPTIVFSPIVTPFNITVPEPIEWTPAIKASVCFFATLEPTNPLTGIAPFFSLNTPPSLSS